MESIESKKNFQPYNLISNKSNQKKRIRKHKRKELNLKYKIQCIKTRKKETLYAIEEIGREPKNIAIIGDRIFYRYHCWE